MGDWLTAGLSTEHVARHVVCSSQAICNLHISFQTEEPTTSAYYNAWSRPLYHEHAFAQSIPNCHCYCR